MYTNFWCALILAGLAGQAKPLPDSESFRKDLPALVDVRGGGAISLDGSLAHDKAFDQYTYRQKKTSIILDSKGKTKNTTIEIFDVTRNPDTGQVYRKPVSKNGVPVSGELPPPASRVTAATGPAQPPRDLAAEERDIQAEYDIHVAWSEPIDGHAVVALTLQPRPRYKPKTRLGEWQQHYVIRLWMTEQDHVVVRQESEAIEEIRRMGPAIKKGTTIKVEQRLINGEVWIPVRTEFHTIGSFMPKGEQGIFIEEYSDFRKFGADVILNVGAPVQ